MERVLIVKYSILVVDYVFILQADVDLDLNVNEIRDTRYVTPDELRDMFKQAGKYCYCWQKERNILMTRSIMLLIRGRQDQDDTVVQVDRGQYAVRLVGEARQSGRVQAA